MSSVEKYRKLTAEKEPCGCLGDLEDTGSLPKFKTCLHTNNLLATGHDTIQKGALSMSGFKNHELLSSLKFLQKGNVDFSHLQVDFDNGKNTTIDIDFTKITRNNPITVSLKLFLSKSTCPKTIKKYVDVFQKIYSDTLVENEYASKKDCLEKLERDHKKVKEGQAYEGQVGGDAASLSSGHVSEASSNRSSISGQGTIITTLDQDGPPTVDSDPCSKFKIDMLVLSLSKNIKDYSIQDYVYPFYKKMEELVLKERVKNVGLSDVTSDMLKELEEHCDVKPSVVQVKYTSMNRLDKEITDMISYGEKNDVLMLRHSDEVPFLTTDKLNGILSGMSLAGQTDKKQTAGSAPSAPHLKAVYPAGPAPIKNIDAILRYTLTSKMHSVLLGKGYFIFEN